MQLFHALVARTKVPRHLLDLAPPSVAVRQDWLIPAPIGLKLKWSDAVIFYEVEKLSLEESGWMMTGREGGRRLWSGDRNIGRDVDEGGRVCVKSI